MSSYILSIDQGTTGTTALLINDEMKVVTKVNQEFRQIFPKPGWVEHDLNDIWNSTRTSVNNCRKKPELMPSRLPESE